jgi:hypothetical protein
MELRRSIYVLAGSPHLTMFLTCMSDNVMLSVLGICPRGNHRDNDIATVSMIYYVFIEYPLKITCID